MDFLTHLQAEITKKKNLYENLSRRDMIDHVIRNREALVAEGGALARWTEVDSTGRSPKDTLTVRHESIVADIDWESPNNLPLAPDTFQMILSDVLEMVRGKERIYVTDRVVGADSRYALPVRTVTDQAVTALFSETMFRPIPADLERSLFAHRPFTLVALPTDKLDGKRYEGKLRRLPSGATSPMVVAIDYVNRIGVVVGSSYMGSVKKLLFTVMNYFLPAEGILPLHTSANEGQDGDIALFLGLSGTGKTTLSADPDRLLLGDDEHGWDDNGVANFENGCYAKLIHLNPAKEPEIHDAICHHADPLEHGAIVENALMYPSGRFDFNDQRLTENSRGSYPLSFLRNIKPSAAGGHPRNILFLTADANGVLPPVASLTEDQAMLWFLMGYTSKLAGTETGIKDPVSTFSRFFGEPFMPRNPDVYASMLGEKLRKYQSSVFLINTGWSGGPYGEGRRMDIAYTRAIITAVLEGKLKEIPHDEDPLFHIRIPRSCPGVPSEILNPRNTWKDPVAFDKRAQKLAAEFAAHFDKAYGKKNIAASVKAQCPGR